jgi:hypothetical protein
MTISIRSGAIFVSLIVLSTSCTSSESSPASDASAGASGGSSSAGGAPSSGATAGANSLADAAGNTVGTGGSATGAGGHGTTGTGGGITTATGGGSSIVDAGGPDQVAPPVQVAACDALGKVGEWQNVLPAIQTLAPNAKLASSVAVDPVHAGTLYVGTATGEHAWAGPGQGIFKSTDCGATWKKVNTGLLADSVDEGVPWAILVDPVEPEVLYHSSGYGDNGLLKSTNGGVDWKRVFPPDDDTAKIIGWAQIAAIDPTNHLHLLLSMHDVCKGSFNSGCMGESKDGGETWRLFQVPTSGFSHSAGPVFIDSTTWLYAAGADGTFYTKDSGDTWDKVANSGFPTSIRVGGTYLMGSLEGILESADGHAWNAIPSTTPAISLLDDGNTLWAAREYASDNQAFSSASRTDLHTWTSVKTPPIQAGGNLAYDTPHHLLYSADWSSGLWRVVTR